MKSKLLVILSTLVMALALMAQSATQTMPPAAGDNTKTCSCCNHDKADGKMACCGKDGGCCKNGKCDMASKDGKMACCGKDGGCCKDGKCDMSKDGKSCCDGMKCERKAGA